MTKYHRETIDTNNMRIQEDLYFDTMVDELAAEFRKLGGTNLKDVYSLVIKDLNLENAQHILLNSKSLCYRSRRYTQH